MESVMTYRSGNKPTILRHTMEAWTYGTSPAAYLLTYITLMIDGGTLFAKGKATLHLFVLIFSERRGRSRKLYNSSAETGELWSYTHHHGGAEGNYSLLKAPQAGPQDYAAIKFYGPYYNRIAWTKELRAES